MPSATQNQIDAVLFDLYGTLVDIEIDTSLPALWSRFSGELTRAGICLSSDHLSRRYADLVRSEECEHGQAFILDSRFFHKLLDNRTRPLSDHLVTFFGRRFRALTTRNLALRSYVRPLFAMLKRSGCRVGLVSNTEPIVTGHDLDSLNMRDRFDTVVLSASVGIKKPDAGIFHIALRRLGVLPARSLFVGDDHVADFHGPRTVGISPVLLCREPRCTHSKCTKPTLDGIAKALQHRGWIPPENTGHRCVLSGRSAVPILTGCP